MNKAEGAYFASVVYEMVKNDSKIKGFDKIDDDLKENGFDDFYVKREHSSHDVVTFYNDTDKKAYIIHRGTDTGGKKTRQDIGADFLVGIGKEGESNLFNKRKNKTEIAVKALPDDYDLFVAGHSLGGGTMGYTLENSKFIRERTEKARLYNSAVSPLHLQKTISKKKRDVLDDKVVYHRTRNDIVSAPQSQNLRYGTLKTKDTKTSSITKYIPSRLSTVFNTLDALDAHGLYHWF